LVLIHEIFVNFPLFEQFIEHTDSKCMYTIIKASGLLTTPLRDK